MSSIGRTMFKRICAGIVTLALILGLIPVDGFGVVEVRASENQDAVLVVSDIADGTYTEAFSAGEFTVHAASGAAVVVEANTKGEYTKRLKMGGAGSVSARSVEYTAADAAEMTLYLMSSKNTDNRVVILADAEGNEVSRQDLIASDTLSKLTFDLPQAGTYYVWSASGGINFYAIEVAYAKEPVSGDSDDDTSVSDIINADADIYVAPGASGCGTAEDPADFLAALSAVEGGHSIIMLDGTYSYDEMIVIDKENSGSAEAMKTVKAANANAVTIDFSAMGYTGSEADKAKRGIALCGSFWHFYGINITGAADNGMILAGNNNILEMCVFAGNHDSGLQVSRFDTKAATIDTWPSYNLIKNCTAYNNSDITGENADGFAAKLTCGEGNVFDGCMSYCNSDDGWDLYAKTETGKIGVVTIKNCIAFRNGKLTDGTGSANGDMNGFKLGSSQGPSTATPHIVENCIAFENGAHGFTDNGNQSGITLNNCTSFNNSQYETGKANFQMDREVGGINTNLLSFNTVRIGSDGFVGTVANSVYYNNAPKYFAIADATVFSGKEKLGTEISVSAADFVSITCPDTKTTDFHKVWRNEDGSLNTGEFLKVKSTSPLASMASDGSSLGSRIPTGEKIAEIPDINIPGTGEESEGGEQTPGTETGASDMAVAHAHNFTENYDLADDFFNFSGNLSDSKGTVTYNGMTLTKCFKMESATEITFTAEKAGTLTMVFNSDFAKNTKIDDVKMAATAGILEVEITEGAHTITKGDTANLYYIALSYPAEKEEPAAPALPEVDAIETLENRIDVYDFGAQQFAGVNNVITADVVNSWFPGVEAGTTGKNLASFTVSDASGNTVLAFNDGGFATTHRLRSTNTEITRYDAKSLKNAADEVAYTGYIYSNKSATNAVNVQVALNAGDKVTLAVASNGTDSNIGFKAPSGAVDSSYTHTLGSSVASEDVYYASETGLYTIYSINEKLVLARITVEHAQKVNVVGVVSAPAELTADYSVVFTCEESGEVVKASVENGVYAAVLNNGCNYIVSLENAEGYVVISDEKITVGGGSENYMQSDIRVAAVELVTVDVEITGLDSNALAVLKLNFASDKVFVPAVKDGKLTLEVGVIYTLTAENVEDYTLLTTSLTGAKELTKVEIIFVKKPVYKVNITPVGAEASDLANAKFIFSRHSDADITSEDGYVYTFIGTENIELRNGVYTVKVADSDSYIQQLTSNLTVNGAEVTKAVKFESEKDVCTVDYKEVITVGAADCDYKTINEALAAVRAMTRNNGERVTIEIQPGNYEEMLVIDVPNVTLKNASKTPSTATLNKGVDIDANAVRITSYYGHGYTYYSMDSNCKYDAELLEVNKENGYASFENPGSGTTSGSYWNATVSVNANGFEAEGIIFENSFNQYVSEKAANDVIVAQSSAKEGTVKRAEMLAGDTAVQNKKYVERAAALAIYNNIKNVSFDNCKFIGRQDTLYGGTDVTAAFYGCDIYGGTDYIFGGMTAVFAKCNLVANTMEDGNDVFYITAPQQKSGRGYLMYNCTITSTEPGVDTASEQRSKAGYFGRPWQADTSEVVFYATNIEKAADGKSLISPKGWLSTLSGTSNNVYEYATVEVSGEDNSAARESWTKVIAEPKFADGSDITVQAFLGDWDAFAGKDMTVVGAEVEPEVPSEPEIPSAASEFVLEANTLTAFAAGAKADGEEEKAGTENYFTIIYSAKSKIDSSNKTWDDGYASGQRINLGGAASVTKNSVKFTTTNPASVKIWWAEGGDDNRQIAILNGSGSVVAKTNDNAAKNAAVLSTISLEEAGTYYLGGDINNNYIFKIVVTEEAPAPEPFTMTFDAAADLTAFAAGAKADGTEEKAGTDNYFTVIYSAKSKVDSSTKTFDDGHTSSQRLNLGGKATTAMNSVKFTTANPASVKIWWVEGGDDNRQMAILNGAGEIVAKTDVTVAKNATAISTLELSEAGTYYLGGETNNNYIFRIEVTETPAGGQTKPARADWSKVDAPVITAASDNGAGAVVVTVKAEIGYDGADSVLVKLMDENGETAASKRSSKEGSEVTLTIELAKSGAYTVIAEAERDGEQSKASASVSVSYVLPLAKPVMKDGYTNLGNGTVNVEWSAVAEAEHYVVTVKGTEISIETEALSTTIRGLNVGQEYTVSVIAVRGSERSAEATILVTPSAEAVRPWFFSAYGSSIDKNNNGYIKNGDGSVTVYSENGKGKIVPGSTDGLSFYYAPINPETENFTLTADVHVNNWTLSNGQEGFGLMAADTVGVNGDGTAFWSNAFQLLSSKVEYYWDGEAVTADTNAAKITMKLGLGVTAKQGITAQDIADIKSGAITMPAGFTTETVTLDTAAANQGAGSYNLVGNYVGVEPTGNLDNLVTDFKLQIQRNNTGYIMRYLDTEGNVIAEKLYYDLEREALTKIDAENIYIGFFASRNARITVSNIELTTINPADDEEAEQRETEMIYPAATVESATFANSADYEFVYYTNMDGQLTVTAADGSVLVNAPVKANKKFRQTLKLTAGSNAFTVVLNPDDDFVPGEYKEMTSLDDIIINHTVLYRVSDRAVIYVSANGSDNGIGSKADPMSIYAAVKAAAPGTQIVLLSGTYNLTRTVKVERGIDGTADKMIYMIADPEASSRPVLDFGGRCAGMILAGDYWYFGGFDVTGSADGQKGIQVSGNNNVLDQVNAYMNGNTGIQISRYLGTDEFDEWPAFNLVLNCTSYLNADKGYEDADGFAAKLTVGDGNVFDGCIAAYNADDGWDLFAKVQSGSIGAVTIKNCVAFKNGYVLTVDGQKYSKIDPNGIETDAGNGNGFKMGGDSMPGAHVLMNSVAFANKAKGFDSNSCPDIKVFDSVSFDNESYNVAFYTNTAVNTDFEASGIVSFKKSNSTGENLKFKGTQDASKVQNDKNYFFDGSVSKNTAGVQVTEDWFVSLDTAAAIRHLLSAEGRNADGSINLNGFCVLTDKAQSTASFGGTESAKIEIAAQDETSGSKEEPIIIIVLPEKPEEPVNEVIDDIEEIDTPQGDAFILTDEMMDEIVVEPLSKRLYLQGKSHKRKVTIKLPEVLKAAIENGDVSYSVSYKSSDKSVVKVTKSGWMIGKKLGTATVTVTITIGDETRTFEIKLGVHNPEIRVYDAKKELMVGKKFTINAVARGIDPNAELTFESSDKSVVKVSKSGKVTAVAAGTAKITIKAENLVKTLKITVK